MPSSIDNRGVQMTFDNAAFERNLLMTVQSLDNLKKSLDMTNSTRSLTELQSAGQSFKLDGIANSLSEIGDKFSAMGAIAFSVLNNVVTKAVDAGIRLGKSLSLDQVISGFREYETNMNSIQTIMANTASKGTTLTEVSAALDELNQYADQTIYNFSEMTRNIGTFTAAGVDLDTSTQAIKGIANLAAISGSNSQQASTAMYQLSQALASGTVKLMDWNSVVNAGMGGEVFQKALFETGKTLGTIKDVPMGQTFDQWKDAGNSFRGSLEDGWITAEVLTNTLQGFTGDLTEAQVMSMGYTKEQAAEILKIGEIGKEAATKVKTLTQLISTVKEAVGSGWSESFKIVIGDFEEAKKLFSGISDVIGKMVGESADARNGLLSEWKTLGGRDLLIRGLTEAFKGLGTIIAPIKQVFREFFPKTTVRDLYALTAAFTRFTSRIAISDETASKIRRTLRGLFNVFAIGWEVVKNIGEIFQTLFEKFDGGGDGLLTLTARFGDFLTNLKYGLVEGGKIGEFFDKLIGWVKNPITFIDDLKSKIASMFSDVSAPGLDGAMGVWDRFKERFSGLASVVDGLVNIFGRLWEKITGINLPDLDVAALISGIKENLGKFWDGLVGLFSGDDLDKTLDVVNTGLFAAIVLAFKKFAAGGVNFLPNGLFGDTKGMFKGITGTFNELTGVLKAMQTDIKSEALLKIAAAMAILTVSLVVLSMIDSAALTKALTATAVGFGQMATTMIVFDKIITTGGAAKLTLLASALLILSAALLILSIAVKSLSSLGWEEMAKGLLAVTVILGVLTLAVKAMSKNQAGMIRIGISLLAIAVALNIIAVAMKIFATMSWEELAKGLIGVTGALLGISLALNTMPDDASMVRMGIGLIAVGIALNLMAAAMKIFATMSWEDIGKGLVGIAGGLLAISLGLNAMPEKRMLTMGLSLVFVGFALNLIATAMLMFATMSWSDMGKGIAGMGAALLVLALAAQVMQNSIGGAIAIGVMAFSLGTLVEVLKGFASIGFAELGKGLLSLALTLAVLGVAAWAMTPVLPALFALGAALLLIGAAMALFGVGASLAAAAFGVLARAGESTINVILELLDELITRIPVFAKALAEGLLIFIQTFLDAGPDLVAAISKIIGAVLDAVITNIPKIVEAGVTLVTELLAGLRETFPDLVATGMEMLIALLTGVRDNIGEIVTLVADIIINFLDALALKVPEIIDSVYNFVIAVIEGVVEKLVDVASYLLPKGVELLEGLLNGVINKSSDVLNWFTELPGKILGWIGDATTWVWQKGIDFIAGLIGGIIEKGLEVATWFMELPGKILGWIGEVATWVWQKGIDFIAGLIGGIIEKAIEVTTWFIELPGKILEWIGAVADWLFQKGKDFIGGLLWGVISKAIEVSNWFIALPGKILEWIGDMATWLWEKGKEIIQGLWDGAKEKWEEFKNWLNNLPGLGGLDPGIVGGLIPKDAKEDMMVSGAEMATAYSSGIAQALAKDKTATNSAKEFGKRLTGILHKAVETSVSTIIDLNLGNFSPVITPVLDLTGMQKDAKKMNTFLAVAPVATTFSFDQAQLISTSEQNLAKNSPDEPVTQTTSLSFEQNNYSPKALSTADIYRSTRSQIAVAKLELSIP